MTIGIVDTKRDGTSVAVSRLGELASHFQGVLTMRTVVLLATMIVLSTARATLARQRYEAGHVVHTRRAPVVLHRVVPPFKGIHVYEGRAR